MKLMKVCGGTLGTVILFLSCSGMPTQATGSIQFVISSLAAGSGPTGSPAANLVRVSLFSLRSSSGALVGGSLFTFPGGLAYAQGSVGTTLTLSDIPVGTWAVLVSAGTADSNCSYTTASYNWPYSVVSVAPGVENAVRVTLVPSPVTPTTLFGTDVMGVANLAYAGENVYAATETQLFALSATTASTVSGGTLPTGVTANSLGVWLAPGSTGGATASVYLNTSRGIYTYNGGAGLQGSLAATNPIPIVQSLAFTDSTSPPNYAIVYENDSGFGGAYVSTSYSPGMWENVSLAGEVANHPVSAITATNNTTGPSYAYFATKIGAFQIDKSVVTPNGPNSGNLGAARFFSVPDGSSILSVDALNTGSDPFYVGSASGGWSASLRESASPPVINLTKIPQTSGDGIVRVASFPIAGSSPAAYYVALLSLYNLYVLNTGSNSVKVYPFYSGLPGLLTGMTWSYNANANSYTLYLAGRKGSVGTPGLVAIRSPDLP